jgi:hypothetical protein
MFLRCFFLKLFLQESAREKYYDYAICLSQGQTVQGLKIHCSHDGSMSKPMHSWNRRLLYLSRASHSGSICKIHLMIQNICILLKKLVEYLHTYTSMYNFFVLYIRKILKEWDKKSYLRKDFILHCKKMENA